MKRLLIAWCALLTMQSAPSQAAQGGDFLTLAVSQNIAEALAPSAAPDH